MPPDPGVEVSVIVPVRDGAGSLPALLRSLEAQSLDRARFEVVVVDNASRDGTAAVAASHGARVLYEPVANRSLARNRGVAAAQASLYAFTDADCVADPGWLEALLGCASSAPLVAGEVEVAISERPNAVERFEALWRFGHRAWVEEEGWATTANLLVGAEAFHAIHGFDPAWRHYGEDVDFCVRARAEGYGLAYCAGALVEHAGERELRPFLRRFFFHGYGANQAFHRLGRGARTWRDPRPALGGERALREYGHAPEAFTPDEWQRMARLARAGYMARVAGSLWAELRRAR